MYNIICSLQIRQGDINVQSSAKPKTATNQTALTHFKHDTSYLHFQSDTLTRVIDRKLA